MNTGSFPSPKVNVKKVVANDLRRMSTSNFPQQKLTSKKCALLTLEFALLTAAPRLKAVVSIFDALMTSAPTKQSLAPIAS